MASGLFTTMGKSWLKSVVRLAILLCAVVLPSSAGAQDQWVRAGEAQTGDLNVLSMIYVPQHPSYPQGVIFAGTLGHGLWRSTDGDH